MPVSVRLVRRGGPAYQRALRAISPRESPDWLRRWSVDWARGVRDRARTHYLSGPRPRRLGRVSGELAGSLTIDRSSLPGAVEVGVSGTHFWAEFHERGLGRFPRRAFIEPAIDDTLADAEDSLTATWSDQCRTPSTSGRPR